MALQDLRYFIAAAKTQHFGRAASSLNISQPAISRQIRELETELGISLFERLSRGVRLSKAGEAFFEHACRIMADYERACEYAVKASRGEIGEIRLGFNDFSLGYEIVPRTLKRFRSKHSQIHLNLIAMSSAKQLEWLKSGQLDAGFMYYFDIGEKLDHLLLGRESLALALPIHHPLARKKRIVASDLVDRPFIGIRRDAMPEHHDHVIEACRTFGLAPKIVLETHNEATLLRLVSAEIGLGLVRSSLAIKPPRNLRIRLVPGLNMDIKFGLVWRQSENSAVLQNFVSSVRRLAA